MNNCILGAGAWGTSMALHLHRNGHVVSLAPRRMEQAMKQRVAKELPEKTEVDLICPIKSTQREHYASYLNKSSFKMENEIGEIMQHKALAFLLF